MTFSQKRFVDIGQALYIEWFRNANVGAVTEEKRREVFAFMAKASFEAAEEFAKVFEHQEVN